MDPQTAQAIACGHPSVYDREFDDPRPVLPFVVSAALSIVTRGILVPGSTDRPKMVEAATALVMWASGGQECEFDDANPHGIARPL